MGKKFIVSLTVLLVTSFICAEFSNVEARVISFSEYQWTVKSGKGKGPGPNNWGEGEENVRVDKNGDLHLRITKKGGRWYCAQVDTTNFFGPGTYQFYVISVTHRLDRLDPNVVLGLFTYGPPYVGVDGTNEIDIEIARWGEPKNPNLNYVVYPAVAGYKPSAYRANFLLSGNYTTHRFFRSYDFYKRMYNMVYFRSLHGHRDDNKNQFAEWIFQPTDSRKRIPQNSMPVKINLWLRKGLPPTDGKEVEVIIRKFKFTPLKYYPIPFKVGPDEVFPEVGLDEVLPEVFKVGPDEVPPKVFKVPPKKEPPSK